MRSLRGYTGSQTRGLISALDGFNLEVSEELGAIRKSKVLRIADKVAYAKSLNSYKVPVYSETSKICGDLQRKTLRNLETKKVVIIIEEDSDSSRS